MTQWWQKRSCKQERITGLILSKCHPAENVLQHSADGRHTVALSVKSKLTNISPRDQLWHHMNIDAGHVHPFWDHGQSWLTRSFFSWPQNVLQKDKQVIIHTDTEQVVFNLTTATKYYILCKTLWAKAKNTLPRVSLTWPHLKLTGSLLSPAAKIWGRLFDK